MFAPPASLPAAGGWHVGRARDGHAGCASCIQTESWASTVPYADPPNQLPPHVTMARLPASGVIVHITRSWEPTPPAWEHDVHPLRVVRSQIRTNFEGNTTHGRVSLWAGQTWRAGSFVTVWVLFGSSKPPAAVVTRAQRELDAARLPVWRK